MATTSVHRWTYDVFVSFRGKDIRKTFMDHLFKDFKQKGIHAFRDDNQLPRGEEISCQLYKAIEESRILIVIFSKNYASSSWCLRELVKIVERMEMGERKHAIGTIFYDVKPDVVRKLLESYAEAFVKHEFSNRTEAPKWKKALIKASNVSGWDLQDVANGYESKFIDAFSGEILEMLCDGPLHVGENLVGLNDRIKKLNLLRFVHSNKVHMIGICGIGGIGKTTFAKAIYNLMYIHFEECCFLDDVQGATKRHGLTHVVMQLINDIMKTTDVRIPNIGKGIMIMKQRMAARRILLVLDDVDHHDQLEALVGSSNWFFPGSLIIFTSKDKQLLANKVDEIYDLEFLDDDEALELFSLYAFHEEFPTEDFEELAMQVVEYVQGHPLTFKVLGCFLCGKTVQEWKSELDSLQVYLNEDIHQVLRLPYDGLNHEQQKIFLDIACSFIGENIDFVARVLDSCNYFADTNIRVLVDKSLIAISRTGSLHMHDLILRMAIEIVRKESDTPGKRSRLWNSSEIYDVLSENKATEAVEVLDLLQEVSCQKVHIDCKAFTHMKNLRILKICDQELEKFRRSFQLKFWEDSGVNYSGKLEFLSNKIRLLYWHRYPFKFLPLNFYPENIVAIDLSYSHIKNLWTTPKCFRRLKVIKLSHCRNLTSTPDFTWITNLEELILEGCVNLVNIHPSFGMLKRLVVINMRDCNSLRSFPNIVEVGSLEVINLSGCSKVDKLPELIGTIQALKEFCIDGTAITELPYFVLSQCNLQVLKFGRRQVTRSTWWTSISQLSWLQGQMMQHPECLLMPSFAGLSFLRKLNFSYCNMMQVSDSIGGLLCLEKLTLSGNKFTSLPESLSQLSCLQSLQLSNCKELEVLPELPPSLHILQADGCTSLHELQGSIKYNHLFFGSAIIGCPNLFKNPSIENQNQVSSQPDFKSSITSHNFRNQLSCLLRYMKFPSNTCGIFNAQERHFRNNTVDVIYHGNRIPEWFTNRNMGEDVDVELPLDWCYDKFRGYGMCVVFTPQDYYQIDDFKTPKYCVNNFDGTCLVDPSQFYYDRVRFPKTNIIWFHFSTKNIWEWKKAEDIVTFSFEDNDHVEVKECGVRLVFDEETDLSIIQDLPTPSQDGGFFSVSGDSFSIKWS